MCCVYKQENKKRVLEYLKGSDEDEEEENLFAKKASCQKGLQPLIADHSLHSHLYADDTQVCGWSPSSNAIACSKPVCCGASTTWRGGHAATGCSWTHRRLSSSGVLLHVVAITFFTETYKSVTTQYIRSTRPETSVCTLTVPWRWGLTSTMYMYCPHVIAHCD